MADQSGLFDGLKGIALKYVKAQILAALEKSAPWLFGSLLGWIANPIIGGLLDWLIMFALDKTILGVSLVWVVIDVSYDVTNAEDATRKLKEILDNPEKYTAEQIKETEASFDAKAIELIRIGITHVP